MEVLRGIDGRPAHPGPSATTIGAFAVVHRGHQALISRVIEAGRRLGAVPSVVTFDRHPLEILRPEVAPCRLATLDQRLDSFRSLGIERVLLVPFTSEVSALTPAEFARRALADSLDSRFVVVGQDFRFGHDRAGDVRVLTELGSDMGFEVEAISVVGGPGRHKVSTSEVRRLVLQGDVRGASALLGSNHLIAGTVVPGDGRGRDIGFPTANLAPDERICLPEAGIYTGWWVEPDRRLPGAVYVGDKPTLAGRGTGIEIHVFDIDEDLYGRRGQIEFGQRLRGDRTFPSVAELIEQMARDVADARRLLTGPDSGR